MELSSAIAESAMDFKKTLKQKQVEAITAFAEGNDVFVSLPTGYGKSLIYAILPHVFDKMRGRAGSIVMCITPLVALMIDQQEKFVQQGMTAEFLGGSQKDRTAEKRVLQGKCQLVFVTPEGILDNERLRSMLISSTYKEHLVGLVVDEAHCVKTWGDSFRTVFSRIGELRSLLESTVQVMALTATATTEIYHTVTQRLNMKFPHLVSLPPSRDNITYNVQPPISKDALVALLAEELNNRRTSYSKTILYVRSLSDCSELYRLVRSTMGESFTEPPGYPDHYKFRLVDMMSSVSTTDKKKQILSSFKDPDSSLRLVISTTAFGLGIDIQDIGRIIHWGIPSTLEEYVQETGRAGRDNSQAVATLYAGKGGKHSVKKMMEYTSNKQRCRRRFLFENFISYHEKDIKVCGCKCCDICSRTCDCEVCN